MTKKVLILKIIATLVLFASFVFLAALIILMAPLMIAFAMKGHGKLSSLIEVIPLGIIVGMLVKLWKPPEMSEEEKAYFKGIGEGLVKGARKEGQKVGRSMVVTEEYLGLTPVYETRGRGKKRNNEDDTIPF